jgi:hypothetical protein
MLAAMTTSISEILFEFEAAPVIRKRTRDLAEIYARASCSAPRLTSSPNFLSTDRQRFRDVLSSLSPRRPRLATTRHVRQIYQIPGNIRQRTWARYASYCPLPERWRSSARARPKLQLDANTITKALRKEMLCNT